MGLKNILNKKLNLKTFVIIQSLSLLYQWILIGSLNLLLFYIFPSFVTDSLAISYTLNPLTRLLLGGLYSQGFLFLYYIDVNIRSYLLQLVLGITIILFSYGLLGYFLAKLRKQKLTLGYALFCIVAIAVFYTIIGLLLTKIGLIQWS